MAGDQWSFRTRMPHHRGQRLPLGAEGLAGLNSHVTPVIGSFRPVSWTVKLTQDDLATGCERRGATNVLR
jgi:hypothetical protein